MTITQKIVYNQALETLKGIEAIHNVVSRKVLFPDENIKWGEASDQVVKDLRECVYLFQTIINEQPNQ